MKYFKYQQNRPMGSIWSLFRDLAEQHETATTDPGSPEYAHSLEIINSAMSGKLSTTPERVRDFDLKAYEHICDSNDSNTKFNRAKKELNIVELDSTTDKDTAVGYGDVSDKRIKVVEDVYDELITNTSFEDNIRELYNIRSMYITTHGVDIVSVLRGALEGIPEAKEKAKELVGMDNRIRELFFQLCEDGSGKLLAVLGT